MARLRDTVRDLSPRQPMAAKKGLVILIPYFGPWPPWFRFFLESCRWNYAVNWLVYTDNEAPENAPSNVRFVRTPLREYLERISDALAIKLSWNDATKLRDVRPALGFVHEKEIRQYSNFGYGEID